MADRTIGDLPAASQLLTADLIPIEQGGNAKSISGQILAEYARAKAQQAAGGYATAAAQSAADAAASAEEAAAWSEHPPYIGANGNWWIYNTTTGEFADSGVDASITVSIADITMTAVGTNPYVTNTGTNTDPIFHLFIPASKGIQSITKTGTSGNEDTYTVTFNDTTTFQYTVTNGADGVSPVVSVSAITGGHAITITDAAHPSGQTVNVMDGNDGVSPGVSITAIAGGHRVTITDAAHPGGQSVDILNGNGAGDMVSSTYDPQGTVAAAGGIPAYVANHAPAGGVTSFNSRTGAITPQSGDYTPAQVGATPVIGKGVNLLDNWYFVGGGSQQGGGQFPINQRGNTSYTGNGYGIDRWKTLSGFASLTLNSGYISVTSNSSEFWVIGQKLEQIPSGNDWTVSVLTSDGLDSFTFTNGFDGTYQTGDNVNVWITTEGAVYIGTKTVSQTVNIIAIKLELGSEQTLARNEGTEANPQWVLNDPPPNYQQELAKCQRYFYHWNGVAYLFVINQGNPATKIDFPVTMRATPTISNIEYSGSGTPNSQNTSKCSTLIYVDGETGLAAITAFTASADL